MRNNIDKDRDDAKDINEIELIAESIKNLFTQAFLIYKPIVDDICSGRKVECKELEDVLDGLLSMCLSDEMVNLFKRVCRKFYYQYPEIITDYVLFYKEMYEEEGNDS